jgi:hypothetical protein
LEISPLIFEIFLLSYFLSSSSVILVTPLLDSDYPQLLYILFSFSSFSILSFPSFLRDVIPRMWQKFLHSLYLGYSPELFQW